MSGVGPANAVRNSGSNPARRGSTLAAVTTSAISRRRPVALLCDLRRSQQWLGLPLALVLDHIDGDPTNNRRENLRLVCPNCDSQLATYKSRNRGNGRDYRRQRYADGQSY